MSQDAMKQMQADKALVRDLEKATTPDEIRDLLHAAVERSGVAARDPESGRFIRRDPPTPAAQVQTDEPKQITKVEKIGGRDFAFTGTEESVAEQIIAAYKVAEALTPAPEPQVRITRQKTSDENALDAANRAELELAFKRGEIDTAEYLQKTGAVDEYLASRGFDVEAASQAQMNAAWAQATEEFLATTPEWKGGQRNLEQIGTILLARGWNDATDKVAALRAAFKEMQEKGLEFDGDVSPEQIVKMTESLTPQQILEAFKEGQNGDPDAANKAFIEAYRNPGDSSGLFNH